MFRCSVTALFLTGISLTAAACSSVPVSSSPPALRDSVMAGASNKIQHVVIVMQEARSFDNFVLRVSGSGRSLPER